MLSIEEQLELVRDAGFRLTQPRLAVIQVLAEAESLLDASAILEIGRGIHERLGRVSVYRTLDLLTGLGLARKVHGPDGCHNYGRAQDDQGHYLVCTACGQISEFACEGLEEVIEAVSRRSGFSIHGHLLQLEGTCPGCSAAAERGIADGSDTV